MIHGRSFVWQRDTAQSKVSLVNRGLISYLSARATQFDSFLNARKPDLMIANVILDDVATWIRDSTTQQKDACQAETTKEDTPNYHRAKFDPTSTFRIGGRWWVTPSRLHYISFAVFRVARTQMS